MKKMYATTEVFEDGFRCLYHYFPTIEAGMKMFEGDKKDNPTVNRELIFDEIEFPAKLKTFDKYHVGSVCTKDGDNVYWLVPFDKEWDIFANVNVVDFNYDEREYHDIDHSSVVIDVTTEEAKTIVKEYIAAEKEKKRHSYDEFLDSPFAKEWLDKMQYTERVDEYGHKFLFIAIKCGYEKISNKEFQKLCDAICMRAYGDELRMTMWIGGKVNWTMFYYRPAHVNGHETYFCGVVAQDDYSPEDFDRDHSEYSFPNAERY